MSKIKIKLKEDKGSEKRYVFEVIETPFFLSKLFGAEDKAYKILVMSRRKINVEKAQELAENLFEHKELWKTKKGKKCDYIAVLPDHSFATFFITNSKCNNESDNTNTKPSRETNDE